MIGFFITAALYNPRQFMCTYESRIKSELDYDVELFREVWKNSASITKNLGHGLKVFTYDTCKSADKITLETVPSCHVTETCCYHISGLCLNLK